MGDSKSYRLLTDPIHRAGVVDRIADALLDLPVDEEYDVLIKAVKETRRDIQNKLLWRGWHKPWAEFQGLSIKWVHGETKLDMLLPMKLACDHDKTRERAEFEAEVLAMIPDREIKIEVAYDLIHSRDIPVKLFAEWLKVYQQVAAEQGCSLESKTAEYDELEAAA